MACLSATRAMASGAGLTRRPVEIRARNRFHKYNLDCLRQTRFAACLSSRLRSSASSISTCRSTTAFTIGAWARLCANSAARRANKSLAIVPATLAASNWRRRFTIPIFSILWCAYSIQFALIARRCSCPRPSVLWSARRAASARTSGCASRTTWSKTKRTTNSAAARRLRSAIACHLANCRQASRRQCAASENRRSAMTTTALCADWSTAVGITSRK